MPPAGRGFQSDGAVNFGEPGTAAGGADCCASIFSAVVVEFAAVESMGGWPGGSWGCAPGGGEFVVIGPANGGVMPEPAKWPRRSTMVTGRSPAFDWRVLSATCPALTGGNCNWPRQRFTLRSKSSAAPDQGSALTVTSSGLGSAG